MASGTTTKLTDVVFTNGKTEEVISVSGVRTICKDMAHTSTLTEYNTTASTETIRKKGTGSTTGQMAANTKVGGTRESSMDSESTQTLNVGPGSMECGSLASALNGLIMKK